MVTLVVMGAVIMHLNKKESEEDQEEQKMFYTIFGWVSWLYQNFKTSINQ